MTSYTVGLDLELPGNGEAAASLPEVPPEQTNL